jgi:glycosyltransferase involved in cell wall biosynthesis
MPRVAMLIQKYYPHAGGAEKVVQRLAPRLQTQGFEVCVLTRHEKDLSRSETIDGVPIYRLPAPGPKPLAAISYILSSVRLLSRLNPDLIHAHEILSPASAAMLFNYYHRQPIVATLHRGGLLGDIYKLKRRPFGKQRLRSLARGIDAFAVISQEIDSELAGLGVLPEKRVFIPNGVDTTHFSPIPKTERDQLRDELSLPRDALIIVYAGRFVPEKRVDHLLTLWPGIRLAFPQALLLLIGTGDETSRLQAMSGPAVQFTGQVEDAARYLQAADIFVLPSSTEGLSVAMLEALSSGLPALVTAVGGAPDVIQDDVNGYLIPPDDLPALKQGLLTLLGDESLRARLGQRGRECILSHYSLDSVAMQLGALYRKLLGA